MNSIFEKRILVTGWAGFIGSNIIDHLVSIGHKNVVVLDNLETGSLENIKAHITSGSVNFINGDILSNPWTLKQFFFWSWSFALLQMKSPSLIDINLFFNFS